MAPKPFPYPLGVGVDMCHIPRLYRILGQQGNYVTRWARRVFTRLEWPHLSQKFVEASAQPPRSEILKAQLWLPEVEHITTREQRTHPASSPTEALNLLQAETAQYKAEPHHEMRNTRAYINGKLPGNAHLRPLPPFRSPPTHDLSQLAQYLAGRSVPSFLF